MKELLGIRDRKWNSERRLVFMIVTLEKKLLVSCAHNIKKRLEWRMDAWLKNQHSMLVQDTENTLERMLTKKQGMTPPEQRAKTFHQKVSKGDLRGAVRYITGREMVGVLLPDDKCSKTGLPVSDVLDSKHPMAQVPDANALPRYEELPELIEVDVNEDSVEDTARKLSGRAGLGGVDSYTLKHWLLGFGRASRGLRYVCVEIIEWLGNSLPPWAAYRALRGGRLCALKNNLTSQNRGNLHEIVLQNNSQADPWRTQDCLRRWPIMFWS
jgi:hypothetical protein